MSTTRAAVLESPKKMVVQTFPKPSVSSETGLLRVEVAGVCSGTDYKLYQGKLDNPWPVILGHEIVGVLEEIGDLLAEANGVSAGDLVILRGSQCGRCDACRSGQGRFCANNVGYGIRRSTTVAPGLWGGYAEHVFLAPGAVLERVPAGVSAERALMATVLANGIYWTQHLGGVRLGQSVVVQGVGQQGISSIIACRQAGAHPIVAVGLSGDRKRLELARLFGADITVMADREDVAETVKRATGGMGADMVVEVTGSGDSLVRAFDLVKNGGTIVYGSVTGAGNLTPVPLDTLIWKQIRIQGVFSKSLEALHVALDYLGTDRVPIERMITHRLPLAQAGEAVETAGHGGEALKVVITPQD